MKISTKGRYAVEIMADLAIYADEKNRVSLKNVADRRKLSEKYLERIIKELKSDGLVSSERGAYGGYCLARNAEEITIREVLNSVEGELAPVECLTKETDCGIDCETCPTRGTWKRMWQEILQVTESVTVADIAAETKKVKSGIDKEFIS